ncbi:major facilitator superfamily domain-containing protein [Collybia nuda]|uniref:Major facilitator superfamily domain-containing protein n=1 Tax=Collybia nuda TaxID=64659 RepID=A0A9P6CRB0_9AGAR|nr:major facilitator superfamily domain-containing protein [Collybia nuda]
MSSPSSPLLAPQPEGLVLPDGPITKPAAELLSDLVQHPCPTTSNGDEPSGIHATRPWYKTPSPHWLLVLLPFATIAASTTWAPRIEIYTQLVCAVHKPDIYDKHLLLSATVPSRCAADPIVQAEVAKLTSVILTCSGVLACVTTGWWGAFSDRHGRTRVMGISIVGLLLTDFNFIFTTRFWPHLPGGYWFLVVGPLVEGTLGGFVSAVASMHAYLADTTTPATRSRVFSLSLGLIFTGMAIGPTLGSLLIRTTGQTISVFYAAGSAHLIYALAIWFVVPESRAFADRQISRAKYAAEGVAQAAWRRMFGFLTPLAVFWPARPQNGSPLKARRDWSLLLLALSYGLTISIMGSYPYKFQYAAAAFGWSTEIIGYWVSLIGAARAVFLTVILPLVIKLFFTPRAAPAPVASSPQSSFTPSETQPLLSPSSPSASTSKRTAQPPVHVQKHTATFDLRLAQASLLIEFIAYVLMGLSTTSGSFTAASLLGATGAGFNPAVQTVALGMFLGMTGAGTGEGSGESGRLFGALSVVQALCSQILGPAGYGLVYMKTAGTFPRAIFLVSGGTVGLALGLLAFVKLRQVGEDVEERGAGTGAGMGGAGAEMEEGDREGTGV